MADREPPMWPDAARCTISIASSRLLAAVRARSCMFVCSIRFTFPFFPARGPDIFPNSSISYQTRRFNCWPRKNPTKKGPRRRPDALGLV